MRARFCNTQAQRRLFALLGVLLCAWFTTASACFPVPMTVAQRAEAADKIWDAHVTGIRLTQFETQMQNADATTQQPEKYQVRIGVVQQLKGKPAKREILEFELDACGGGKTSLREHVLVFLTDGFWYVTAYSDESYQSIISSLKPAHK